jgi:hypothetical protein
VIFHPQEFVLKLYDAAMEPLQFNGEFWKRRSPFEKARKDVLFEERKGDEAITEEK